MSSNVVGNWFISAPADETKQETVDKLKASLNNSAEVYPFTIPEFKVGTLDSLMILSDELQKTDLFVETIVIKLSDALKTLLNNDLKQWQEILVVGDKKIDLFLKSFNWNTMKYRSDKTLQELVDAITVELTQIDTITKSKLQAYSVTKNQLLQLERKLQGNLSVRSLLDVVKKDDFVLNSEYLITLLVAVPKSLSKEWIDNYERLTEMVVPRSSTKITSDDEYDLFNVTLFQRVVDEFTQKARERKFVVRDFKWDPQKLSSEKKMQAELVVAEREQWSQLIRLCKANFSEGYASWLHLKVLRLFIESILRYGLPFNSQTIYIKVANPKQEIKVRQSINKHYQKLEKNFKDDEHDEIHAFLGEKDYSPVVLYAINTISDQSLSN